MAPLPAAGEPSAPDPVAFEGQISGTISTGPRSAVSGATVAVIGEGQTTIHGSNTDSKGRYAIRGLPRDEYAVLVMDPSGTLLRKDGVSVRPLFRNLVDFQVEAAGSPQPIMPSLPAETAAELPPFSLLVQLASRDGLPVTEAWFTAAPLQEDQPARRARSDAAGNVSLEALPAGYYRFIARGLGHVTWSIGPVLMQGEGTRELHLTMIPFPLGHQERIENLVVPIDPASPETFDSELQPASASADANAPDPS
jgi:hypothetical protein